MTKQILILLLLVFVLFIGTNLLKNMTKKNTFNWDYDEIASARDVLTYGKEINDRKIYWQLKDIIYDFIFTKQDSSVDEIDNNDKTVDYLEYYDVLQKKYKKHLSKKDYEKVALTFIEKFLEEDHLGYKYVSEFTIDEIYEYDNNMYLCVVLREDNQAEGYIGIQFDEKHAKFSIFYME